VPLARPATIHPYQATKTTIAAAVMRSIGCTHPSRVTRSRICLWYNGAPMEHLKGLNSAQKEAVLTIHGPVLVLAGAGAGKTRTIAHRIVHIVKSGTPAYRILAITFTNKAAREMRERVLALLSEHTTGSGGAPTVSTFHALSAQLLRQYGSALDIDRHFTIYDRADSLRAMKRAVKAAGEDDKRFEPRAVLSAISKAKGNAQTRAMYREAAGNSWWDGTVAQIWEHYDRIVRNDKALDFDDLLLYTWRLLEEHPDVRTQLQERYAYLHVDEYQDTNAVQYKIVRLIAGEQANIFCVGDLDQNVYSWRGATIENILDFEQAFPHAQTVRLEENYRSSGTIVHVSNEIIKKNKRRKKKTLVTSNPDGEKLTLSVGWDERNEAEQLVQRTAALLAKGVPAQEIAVLFRANFQSRVLEEAFLAAGIPYRVLGTRFFDRKEVKDTLSYLRAALNRESWADITRTINTPTRGIGKVTFEKLMHEGRAVLSGRAKEKVDDYFAILDAITAAAETKTASEAIAVALDRSGIARSLSGKNEEDQERLENVKELVSLAKTRYDDLGAPDGLLRLFEDAALATDQDELDQRTDQAVGRTVTLMTIHASKGLEFAHVFVTGLEDGLFPHQRMDERGTKDEEEERRLFYVALTRAKAQVHLSYAQTRTIFGQRNTQMPSEFLLDIPDSYIETDDGGGVAAATEKVVYLD